MKSKQQVAVVWLRRDLRLQDNAALHAATRSGLPVVVCFIFDTAILNGLDRDDARVGFIHELLDGVDEQLRAQGSALFSLHGEVLECWQQILAAFEVKQLHYAADYEPYARERDARVRYFLRQRGVECFAVDDQLLLPPGKVLKADGSAYVVFGAFQRAWLQQLQQQPQLTQQFAYAPNYLRWSGSRCDLAQTGFVASSKKVRAVNWDCCMDYDNTRNICALPTSNLGPWLRFGGVSVREAYRRAKQNSVLLSELVWREFFMHILWHYPTVTTRCFRPAYDGLQWRESSEDLQRWKEGRTGFALVDAGMRELLQSGYMHNRVRMLCASFLCKHLLLDWRLGEAHFARLLMDFELSSNNGNWQWVLGSGCDAAPYFRIFNPLEQQRKFDGQGLYIKRWVPEYGSGKYPAAMLDHAAARERCLANYARVLKGS